MKAIFNGEIILNKKLQLNPNNRAFAYGDGIFETMLAYEGKVKLLDLHLERIKEGLHLLKLEEGSEWSASNISQHVERLCAENKIKQFGKVKIFIWRTEGGTYEPCHNEVEHLITAQPIEMDEPKHLKRVGFCANTYNYPNPFSALKTLSAMDYVVAGLEKKSRQLEEIIICDHQGNVSEALVSNIFWIKGNQVYTPSLATGCINGVSRRYLLKAFKDYGSAVNEVDQNKEILYKADHIFTANAMGINHIVQLDNIQYLPFPAAEMIYRPY